MPEYKRYPKGSSRTIISFSDVLGRIEEGCNLLLVSDGLLDIIRMLLRERALWRSTYAIDYDEAGYTRPTVEEFHPVEEEIQTFLEESAMGCDFTPIKEGLVAIANAMAGCCFGGSGGGSGPIQGQTPSGGTVWGTVPPHPGVGPTGVGDPPEGFETWAEYSAWKCNVARNIVNSAKSMIDTLATVNLAQLAFLPTAIGVAAATGVIILTGPILTPLIVALVALGAFQGLLYAVSDWLSGDGRQELTCVLYNSPNTITAVQKVEEWVADTLDVIIEVTPARPLIKAAIMFLFNSDTLNSLFERKYHFQESGADCSDCDPGEGLIAEDFPTLVSFEETEETSVYMAILSCDTFDAGNGGFWKASFTILDDAIIDVLTIGAVDESWIPEEVSTTYGYVVTGEDQFVTAQFTTDTFFHADGLKLLAVFSEQQGEEIEVTFTFRA